MGIDTDLIGQLLKDCKSPEDVLERALQAKLTHHLGYEKHLPEGQNAGNSRNDKPK